ncbi:GIY-YIG catalytic domain-containing protein [Formosa sp. Hel1_31_208]|uniref:GIY-YIG nuclease family protein n=1 Tax=Formosa sp. Hel1_31_208 TaxID=1798225 RepID=UPI00087B8623|nr:GIY-YIG nuclease family protein [Formosa sp. Hel1_31_208]SDS32485.1 GIY-YIG catalytic domain-containing protein [Formosa sp. Hel1_31_208]
MNCDVYILFSKLINSNYVGYICADLKERLRKHNTNHKLYTGRVNDWQLMYTESYINQRMKDSTLVFDNKYFFTVTQRLN